MDKLSDKRVTVGYIKADSTRAAGDILNWQAELRRTAEEKDLDLHEIHVEYDLTHKPRLRRIFDDIRNYDLPAEKIQILLMPFMDDLGFDEDERQAIRDRLSAFDVEIMQVVSQ